MKKITIAISTVIIALGFTFCAIIATNMDAQSEKPQSVTFVNDNKSEMYSRSAIKEIGGCLYVITEYSNSVGTSVSVVPHTSCDCHTYNK